MLVSEGTTDVTKTTVHTFTIDSLFDDPDFGSVFADGAVDGVLEVVRDSENHPRSAILSLSAVSPHGHKISRAWAAPFGVNELGEADEDGARLEEFPLDLLDSILFSVGEDLRELF